MSNYSNRDTFRFFVYNILSPVNKQSCYYSNELLIIPLILFWKWGSFDHWDPDHRREIQQRVKCHEEDLTRVKKGCGHCGTSNKVNEKKQIILFTTPGETLHCLIPLNNTGFTWPKIFHVHVLNTDLGTGKLSGVAQQNESYSPLCHKHKTYMRKRHRLHANSSFASKVNSSKK